MSSTRVLTILALMTGLTLAGFGASSARAADVGIGYIGFPTTPELTVTPSSRPGYHIVTVTGIQRTSLSPEALTDAGYKIEVRLWGNDDVSLGNADDLLAGPSAGRLSVGPEGVRYTVRWRASTGLLDEDIGEDELYAGVRLIDPEGKTIRKIASKELHRSF